MGYDAMANRASAAAARDITGAGKKKRANRTARLKQCKLDARREQWLSQVKSKDCKAVSPTSRFLPPPLSLPCGRKMRAEEEEEETPLHDGSDSESLTQSPGSSRGSGHALRKGQPGNSIGSSCSIGSSSRTLSDMELEDGEDANRGGEDGPLDDWEMVADALTADNDREGCNLDQKPDAARGVAEGSSDLAPTKPEPIRPPPRAWKPDDAARPRSLPSLSKQRSFLASIDPQCGFSTTHGVLSSPCACPICCEDLDVTDSIFLPCSCGFRLCLFCHKRILEEDGRCPGCRKQYSATMSKGIDVGGGDRDSLRWSRSCSMSPRS